jgi:LmbE family N-acetylglucosaminyl deacetylase
MIFGRRVLVVSAHSDDEALGCGATLRLHAEGGAEVYGITLTDGVGSRQTPQVIADASRRREAAERSARLLGLTWLEHGDFPDNGLDSIPLLEVARFIEKAKQQVNPDVVYTHHGGDLNVDHRTVCRAVLTAFRPQPHEHFEELRTFEVPSSTEWSHPSVSAPFAPNLFIDVEQTWSAKRAALQEYSEEMRPFPHARSIEAVEALAVARGSQVGLRQAEAFEVIRRIVRFGQL